MKLIVKTGLVGLGAFATDKLVANDLIVDWSDHPLFQQPPRIPRDWKFAVVSPGVFRGPLGPEEHPDTYINHSCDPNAEIIFARPKIHLIARKSINAGEEVTFDYALLYTRIWSMNCKCGSANCRGRIRGTQI